MLAHLESFFRVLPKLSPPLIRATWTSFLDVKTTFCAYDRKNTDDDNDTCNDGNDGNFDENDDKNDQKIQM